MSTDTQTQDANPPTVADDWLSAMREKVPDLFGPAKAIQLPGSEHTQEWMDAETAQAVEADNKVRQELTSEIATIIEAMENGATLINSKKITELRDRVLQWMQHTVAWCTDARVYAAIDKGWKEELRRRKTALDEYEALITRTLSAAGLPVEAYQHAEDKRWLHLRMLASATTSSAMFFDKRPILRRRLGETMKVALAQAVSGAMPKFSP